MIIAIGIISTSPFDEATKYFFVTIVFLFALLVYIEGVKEYKVKEPKSKDSIPTAPASPQPSSSAIPSTCFLP